MVYELVIGYGIASIFLGIVPALSITIWKFKFKGSLWFSFILGGVFWGAALLARLYFLYLVAITPETQPFSILIGALLAGLFETLFRVLLLYYLTKYTANSKEKVIMTGFGWGIIEAVTLHSIPVFMMIVAPSSELLGALEGYEWTILFGGIERIMVELFHVSMLIFVFYGIKDRLKGISQSEPLAKRFYTKDPKPVWLWILIVVLLHFLFDFLLVSLAYSVGLVLTYMAGFVFVGILISYLTNRIKAYPLFAKENDLKR